LRRIWDRYDAYLFDIDGTLLNCTDAVHYFAFCYVLGEVAGRPLNLDGITVHGNTDVGILRDAFEIAGVPEDRWRPNLAGIKASMCRFVQDRTRDLSIVLLQGVVPVLDHLRSRDAKLGVATGNLEGIGRTKLKHIDLLRYFDFCAFSDDHEFRRDVFRAGARAARQLAGKDAAICVLGDTPLDVQAARDNGLDVIAIATGIFSYETLQGAEPDLCLHSLEELLPMHR
jgi:phosphoglycolate phosphatase-like HAD superfamily hydrolase